MEELKDRESDTDSSGLEYQWKKEGEKRMEAENGGIISLISPKKKILKKQVGQKAASPDECVDEVIDM